MIKANGTVYVGATMLEVRGINLEDGTVQAVKCNPKYGVARKNGKVLNVVIDKIDFVLDIKIEETGAKYDRPNKVANNKEELKQAIEFIKNGGEIKEEVEEVEAAKEEVKEMSNNTNIKVPAKYEKMIECIDYEGRVGGYWVYSRPGYQFAGMGCHTAHEYNKKDLMEMIRTLEPCDCEQCSKVKLGGLI